MTSDLLMRINLWRRYLISFAHCAMLLPDLGKVKNLLASGML